MIAVAMAVVLAVAAMVMAYVAYPFRDRDLPALLRWASPVVPLADRMLARPPSSPSSYDGR